MDLLNKQRILVRDEALLNQLRREEPLIAASFDLVFERDLIDISREYARLQALIVVGLSAHSDRATRAQQILTMLLMNGAETLLGSIELLRSGHRLQPGILLRNVIETVATAAYLCVEPSAASAFHSGALDSPKTVTRAKEVIPFLGRAYGFFSREYAHLGSKYGKVNGVFAFEEDDIGGRVNLSMIKLVLNLLYVITELAFAQFVAAPRHWRAQGGGGESTRQDLTLCARPTRRRERDDNGEPRDQEEAPVRPRGGVARGMLMGGGVSWHGHVALPGTAGRGCSAGGSPAGCGNIAGRQRSVMPWVVAAACGLNSAD